MSNIKGSGEQRWRYSGKPLYEVAQEREFVERPRLQLKNALCVGDDVAKWHRRNLRGGHLSTLFAREVLQNMDALEICYVCPDRVECLQYALDNEETGLWGGVLESQRRGVTGHSAEWLIAADERKRRENDL